MNASPSPGSIARRKQILLLTVVPLVSAAIVAAALYSLISTFLLKDAEEKIKNVLLSHRGFHLYIQKVMHPAFYRSLEQGEVSPGFYYPEVLSSSFMVRNMHKLYNEERKANGLPEVYYKMAARNPRNPVNRADEFEERLLRMFNENRSLTEYRTILSENGQKYLYYAKPFLVNTAACIRCHGKRADAPLGLQARYPGEGGFNEKIGDIRAIESLRMPIQGEISTAFILTVSVSTGVLAMMLLLLFNTRLRNLVRLRTADLAGEIEERKEKEQELEGKNAELERFTYTVSHDLKSPLITIRGFAGSVLKDIENGRNDRLQRDLHRIIDSADKMSELLNDLLELSRIGRIVNAPSAVGMGQLVNDAVAHLAGGLAEKQIRVVVQPDLPEVWVDRVRMVEVFQNLIENAAKYMGDQAEPRIEIGVRDVGTYFVRDNGIGIEECYLETIFGLFNKLDARSEGTGIGLALVRRIIEFHGGRVWAESEGVGKGTTICFTLPAVPDSATT